MKNYHYSLKLIFALFLLWIITRICTLVVVYFPPLKDSRTCLININIFLKLDKSSLYLVRWCFLVLVQVYQLVDFEFSVVVLQDVFLINLFSSYRKCMNLLIIYIIPLYIMGNKKTFMINYTVNLTCIDNSKPAGNKAAKPRTYN